MSYGKLARTDKIDGDLDWIASALFRRSRKRRVVAVLGKENSSESSAWPDSVGWIPSVEDNLTASKHGR